MLKLKKRDTRTELVKGVTTQNQKEEPFDFEVEFRNVPRGGAKEVIESLGSMSDSEVVQKMATGWYGVSDESGPLEFTPENVERVMEDRDYGSAIIDTFWTDVLGLQSIRKN
jgi:hypothetical protein